MGKYSAVREAWGTRFASVFLDANLVRGTFGRLTEHS